MSTSRTARSANTISICAPARLHMGFLDLGGSLGRLFGGLGVALDGIGIKIRMTRSDRLFARGPCPERCLDTARRVAEAFDLPAGATIEVEQSIPQHVGLGSGTQLALAIGVGLHRLHGSDRTIRDIAPVVDRGQRSGIGIAAFEHGGFVVDGGRGSETKTPPLLARFDFPGDWPLILVFDDRGQGLHGDVERAAFNALPPFPVGEAARLCHALLLRGLPALVERDLATFGDVITDIQRTVGDHFAPAQGGRFTSGDVERAMDWLVARGARGVGQTSWGPTGFCIAPGPEQGAWLIDEARQAFATSTHLSFLLTTVRNTGAEIIELER